MLTCSLRSLPFLKNSPVFVLLLTCSVRLWVAGPAHSLSKSKARTFPQTRGVATAPRAFEIPREIFKCAGLTSKARTFSFCESFCRFVLPPLAQQTARNKKPVAKADAGMRTYARNLESTPRRVSLLAKYPKCQGTASPQFPRGRAQSTSTPLLSHAKTNPSIFFRPYG